MTSRGAAGRVRLKPSEDERIRKGHVWIYDNEIAAIEGEEHASGEKKRPAPAGVAAPGPRAKEGPLDGDLVWVEDAKGRKLGTGFLNLKSAIAVRLVTRGARAGFGPAEIDGLLEGAFRRREPLDLDCVRLVNAEGDFMPGLVIDRYGDVVVIQSRIPAWDRADRAGTLIAGTRRLLAPRSVLLKTESGTMRAGASEGEYTPVLAGDEDAAVVVNEAGLEIEVDLLGGQKTGFYIDQRENRASVIPYVPGKRVLDCFSYSGVWSLMCAAGGAREVTGVDSSTAATGLARANARRNRLDETATFVEADVFDYLPGLARAREKYDIVILDPPSLARTRKQVAGAMRGYIHLNKVAMGLLEPGGMLVTCSCSHHMTRERFIES